MAVPDTTTFTLQNVVTEINPTTDDLADCFADAVAASFDSAYSGSKDRLSNFRNYGAVSLASFSTQTNPTTSGKPCGNSTPTTRYHNGASFLPVVNDVVWNTSAGTGVPSTGGYMLANNTYYMLNSSGVVTLVGSC